METKTNAVALYYGVRADENFEEASTNILNLVQKAMDNTPNHRRIFFLDITGHRNDEGGFDQDMYDLQADLMMRYLSKYLSEIHMPLGEFHNQNQVNEFKF